MEPSNTNKSWLSKAMLAVVLASTTLFSHATELYRVSAPATGELAQEQQQAFELLIQRLTGDASSASNPLVQKAKRNITPFVQQFSYQQDSLSVLFNEQAVEQLLMQAELRLWGKQRPDVLAWYAVEQDFDRQLVAGRDEQEWTQAMRQQAQTLAVPLQLPVMDLEDSMALNVNDVWGQFDAPLFTAAQRYGVPLVLAVRQFPQGGQWQASWRLLDTQSETELASGAARAPQQLIGVELVNQVSAVMAERYGVVFDQDNAQVVELKVSGVNTMSRFVELERFLQQQPGVAKVQLKRVNGSDYQFDLQLLSSWQDLQTALDVNPQLSADELDSFHYHYQ